MRVQQYLSCCDKFYFQRQNAPQHLVRNIGFYQNNQCQTDSLMPLIFPQMSGFQDDDSCKMTFLAESWYTAGLKLMQYGNIFFDNQTLNGQV